MKDKPLSDIDITGLDKAAVLAALFNFSKPVGLGILHYKKRNMGEDEAAKLLEKTTYFDYLEGRLMKVDLSGDSLDVWGYDRDNGNGAARYALEVAGLLQPLEKGKSA